MAFSCVVCSADLPTVVKRRVLHPPNEANADVHEFFVSVVAPGYSFASDIVCYTCFATLQKAVKHHVALQDLLEKLRTSLPQAHTPTHSLSQSESDDQGDRASPSLEQSVRPIICAIISKYALIFFAIMTGVWAVTTLDVQEFSDYK